MPGWGPPVLSYRGNGSIFALATAAAARQCSDCELLPKQLEHKGDVWEYTPFVKEM